MQTASGAQFWPLDPRADEVRIIDIARALSNTCRYNGHSQRFYSVAEHSVHVSNFVQPEHAREGLLHDAAEAYVGDMIRPLKHQPEMAAFGTAEAAVERVIVERFALRDPSDPTWAATWADVHDIDNRILIDERDQIMAPPPASWRLEGLEPVGATIFGWSPTTAEALFLARFAELFWNTP